MPTSLHHAETPPTRSIEKAIGPEEGRQGRNTPGGGRTSGSAAYWAQFGVELRSAPEILEAIRRKLGVAHRVLDILVAEPRLQRPGVMAGIGQRVAAAVPQHVRVDWERHFGPLSDPAE